MTIESQPPSPDSAPREPRDRRGGRHVIKNSMANVATGLSIALTSVLVPPVLSRTLSPLEFGAWALVLQIAGYVSILDLGIQGAVGRYIAYYLAHDKREAAEEFASTAFNVLCAAALVGIAGLAVIALYLHALFPQIPYVLLKPARIALGVVGLGICLGLPASTFRGMLTGIERNELVTLVAAPTGLLLSAALIGTALGGFGMVALGVVFSSVKLLSYCGYWLMSRLHSALRVAKGFMTRNAAKEMWDYCGSTMFWTLAMPLISGVDVALVGRFDFPRVAAYAACVGPITILSGVQNAMFSPLIQVGARHYARGETQDISRLLAHATRVSVITTLLCSLPVVLLSRQVLTLWLGYKYAIQAATILKLLLIGQSIRLVATPYATLLLATGQHRRARIVPVVEGITNTAAAIIIGHRLGAVGVACGVIVGGGMGQLMNLVYNFPRTADLVGDVRVFLVQAVLRPIACFMPMVIGLIGEFLDLGQTERVAVWCVASLVTIAFIWLFAVRRDERQWVMRNVLVRAR